MSDKTIDGSDAIKKLNLLIDNLEDIINDSLDEIAKGIQTTAASKTKGNLAKSIKINKSDLQRVIFPDQPYAEFVENGRKAIKAKDNGWLHFTINGKQIYTKKAKAMKAKPFMKPSFNLFSSKAGKIMEKNLKLFINRGLAFA